SREGLGELSCGHIGRPTQGPRRTPCWGPREGAATRKGSTHLATNGETHRGPRITTRTAKSQVRYSYLGSCYRRGKCRTARPLGASLGGRNGPETTRCHA